jgi:hypothetical protein
MAEDLGLALAELFGADLIAEAGLEELMTTGAALPASTGAGAVSGATGADGSNLATISIEELIILANEQYIDAQESLRDGDWANYGLQMDALQTSLERLVELTGIQLQPALPAEGDAPAEGEATPESEPADASSSG